MIPPYSVLPGATNLPIDWAAIESWLGVRLPTAYKHLASEYGPLDIGEYLWMHVPCIQEGRFDYGTWLKETHRHCRIGSGDQRPAFRPTPGGLLAWGMTRSAGYLFWDTAASDDPDQWPVVLFDQDAANNGADPWQRYQLPFADLLTAVVKTGLPSLGPLPPTARRTAFLLNAVPWTPPWPPAPKGSVRRTALTVGSGFEALRQLVPPPADPYLGDGSWDEVFGQLGSRLPTEYIQLMKAYGSGIWSSWLRFVPPLRTDMPVPSAGGYHGLMQHATEINDIYRELRAAHPEFQPLAVWPEPDGFFAFADSIDGDALGWLTIGEPDEWPLIVYPRHYDQGPPLTGNLVDTLLEWLRGREAPECFQVLDKDDDPLEFATFESWRPAP